MNYMLPQTHARSSPRCAACPVRERAPCGAMRDEAGALALERLHAPLRHISAGDAVFGQGDPSDRSYTVVSGWVAICHTAFDGGTTILRFALPGDVVPFERHADHASVSCIAVGEVAVCALSRRRQEQLERDHPEYDARHRVEQGRILALAYEKLTVLASRSAKARVAHLFWELASRSLRRRPLPSDQIQTPLNQVQIGSATSLTPIHVSRTLRILRAQGLLDLKGRWLTLHDPEAVERLSGVSAETAALWA
jgi:CRP-like cAMP-binding protein